MTIAYDEAQVAPEQIVQKVEKAGFGAALHQERNAAKAESAPDSADRELHRKKRELIASAVFSVVLLYVSMPSPEAGISKKKGYPFSENLL